MMQHLETDPWSIIEEDFNLYDSENIFTLGNGQLCQRASFEEYYSGKTVLGTHIYGIYIPKIDRPLNTGNEESETPDLSVNAPNWIGIIVRLNDEVLDLASWEVLNFQRILNMHEGFLERTFEAISPKGNHIQVSVKRFLSMSEAEVGAISYSVKSLNFEGRISFMPVLDADLKDNFQNNQEPIWNVLQTKTQPDVAHLWTQIRRTDFHVCQALTYVLYKNNEQLHIIPSKIEKEKVAGFSTGTDVKRGDTLCLNKYVAILSSLNHPRKDLTELACALARASKQKGWNKLFEEHSTVLAEKWKNAVFALDEDIKIQHSSLFKQFHSFQGLDIKDSSLNV